jgi:hypothetical protein
MAFKKGQSGNPKGRKPSVPNKTTAAAKSAIEIAAIGLGGAKRLQEWASSDPLNERVFWSQIYTKLLPLQVTDGEGKALIPSVVQFVIQKVPGADCKP